MHSVSRQPAGLAVRLIGLLAPALLLCLSGAVAVAGESAGPSLVEALRGGGFNLYFRHAATDWAQRDQVRRRDDWLSCDAGDMRQLSDQGRETAAAIGSAMRRLGIPVSEVRASPYCRTVETAELMQLGEVRPSDAVINMRVASYFGGSAAVIDSARRLLGSTPPDRGNRVIVAHGNVAREATPVYPGEAEAVVFRPDGHGGFSVVGRLSPADWFELAATMGPGRAPAPLP